MSQALHHEGWVPMRVMFPPGGPRVDWCWLGRDRFQEPFFDQTISRALQRPFNKVFAHATTMNELCDWQNESPGLPPAGFIFHMSRCGSTLASQMFAALPDTVVISEASPLDWLARRTDIPEPQHIAWFRAMVSALGQPRKGGETRYIIKFDSMTSLALPFVRRAFPEVPWVFVFRNPEDVLSSQMRQPGAAMTPGFVTDVVSLDLPIDQIMQIEPEEYAARVLARLCDAAIQNMDRMGIAVDYAEMPEAITGRIARHFGMTLSPDAAGTLAAVTRRHAKWPEREFEAPARDSMAASATDAVRLAADRWLTGRFAALSRLAGTATEKIC